MSPSLHESIAPLPAGQYLVAVSGGADSTALARLVAQDERHQIVLAHLNHELRGDESDADEAFVRRLAEHLGVPIAVSRLSNFVNLPAQPNDSARYRAARLYFYRDVAHAHGLTGVLLAHHADDQAETVLLRILRGVQLPALGGMSPRARVGGVELFRPLLDVRREALRDYLRSIDQPWREDASNSSPKYRRNCVRRLLASHPPLTQALLDLAAASARWRAGLNARAPQLNESFACDALRIPSPLADHAAGRWLVARGAPADAVSPATRRRLVDQALRATAAPRQSYPGGILVRRRKKQIDVIPAPPLQLQQRHGKDQASSAGEF